nr:PREDICTED: uncharacterized protein LOC108953661 isoform X1 [Musa acuminata subsp. malaccensis]XP_018686308.1 PREDICTED: uncharacterized protein LOC108953661 isoform X2 [Musa acuminata subsp. malaccensis]XP_018686309.1 PREDICTED: uncharacterized protein LOC108953661 isoform X3 [Musa acuminata subsp. malaccensis]
MEGMQRKGCVHRIRKCAVDLLSMEDDLIDAEGEDGWELTGSELRLKSTFLYCDLHQVIASAGEERKALTLLANNLFYRLEQLDEALKSRSTSWTHVCYRDATHVLQELMAALMPLPLKEHQVFLSSFLKGSEATLHHSHGHGEEEVDIRQLFRRKRGTITQADLDDIQHSAEQAAANKRCYRSNLKETSSGCKKDLFPTMKHMEDTHESKLELDGNKLE